MADFVHVRISNIGKDPENPYPVDNDFWIWLGFQPKDTQRQLNDQSSSGGDNIVDYDGKTAILGMKEGTVFRWSELRRNLVDPHTGVPVEINSNGHSNLGARFMLEMPPLGQNGVYWRDNEHRRIMLEAAARRAVSPKPFNDLLIRKTASGGKLGLRIEIKKRCPAVLRYRNTLLTNRSPYRFAKSELYMNVRRVWVQESELVGTCSDGKIVSFESVVLGNQFTPTGETSFNEPMYGFDDYLNANYIKKKFGVWVTGDGQKEFWEALEKDHELNRLR